MSALRTMRVDWLLLINAIVGSFLAGLSTRIFLISLPTVANGLGTDILGISWALISFQLTSISLSIVFGRLGDIYGRYKIYGLGFAIMTVSSFLCGISTNVLQLIGFRSLQGIGSAMGASTARVLAMDAMPEGSEGKANSFMTMSFHSGFFVGPPLGGFIIDYINWRWTFFLLIPIGLIGIVLTALRSKTSRAAEAGHRETVDYVGASMLVVLTVMLTLLIDRRIAESVGVGQKGVLAFVFLVTLSAFLVHESRVTSPVMDLSLFRIRMFVFSIVSLFIVSFSYSVLGLLMPFYLQEVLHLSPSFMGIIFLTSPLFTIGLAPASGHLTDRIGPSVPASIGVAMTCGAMLTGTLLRTDSHWLLPTVLLAFVGVGSGLFNAANQTAAIGSVPREHRGLATGTVHTVFGLGHLFGISLGGLLLTLMFQMYLADPEARPSPEQPVAFVAAMNATFMVCLGMSVIALLASILRGAKR